MKTERVVLIISLFCCSLNLSCGNDQGKLPQPPANKPLKFKKIEPYRGGFQHVPDPKSWPMIYVSVDSKPFRGVLVAAGKLSTKDTNLVLFEQDSGKLLVLGLALPPKFKLKRISDLVESLYVSRKQSPSGNEQTVTITTIRASNESANLFLGYTWRSSNQPIAYRVSGGITLYQEPVNNIPRGNIGIEARAYLQPGFGQKRMPLSLGLNKFDCRSRHYMIFLHTSTYQSVADPGGGGASGYVLRAIIVEYDPS